MKLEIFVDDQTYPLDVSPKVLEDAADFFDKMDRDMDKGWRMSRDFIERPGTEQRCQIVADRLLTSLMAGKSTMVMLMAAYILKRAPGVTGVEIDTEGEMQNTQLIYGEAAAPVPAVKRGPLSESEAREQAEQQVSRVYKVGKAYRFALRDRGTGDWVESPFADSEDAAEALRTEAIAQRQRELMGKAEV